MASGLFDFQMISCPAHGCDILVDDTTAMWVSIIRIFHCIMLFCNLSLYFIIIGGQIYFPWSVHVRTLISDGRVRLKYQQLITNSFVDVSRLIICFRSDTHISLHTCKIAICVTFFCSTWGGGCFRYVDNFESANTWKNYYSTPISVSYRYLLTSVNYFAGWSRDRYRKYPSHSN